MTPEEHYHEAERLLAFEADVPAFRDAIAMAQVHATLATVDVVLLEVERRLEEPKKVRRAGGAHHSMTDEHLQAVADVYRANEASGRPSRAVAERWSVTPRAARMWGDKARARGFLDPVEPAVKRQEEPK